MNGSTGSQMRNETRLLERVSSLQAEGEGFEPSIRLTTDNGFRDRRIRPLCHPSASGRNGISVPNRATILPSMASPFIELEVGTRTVKVTNPDKVYFPARGETKLDLVRYFVAVGDGIVNALRERPCQLKRQPEGVGGEVIWQKRVPEKRPEWIETA